MAKLVTPKFETDPIDMMDLEDLMQENPRYREALSVDLTKNFFKACYWRLEHYKNISLSVYGQQGDGKSTVGMACARKWSVFKKVKFDVEHIFFSRKKLLNEFKKFAKYEVCVLDEQEEQEVMFGLGSAETRVSLNDLEEVIRKKQKNFIFISPRLHSHPHHYILKAILIDYTNYLNQSILFKPRIEEYADPKGYIITSRWDDKAFWKEYEEKKDAYLETKEQQMSGFDIWEEIREKAQILVEHEKFDPRMTMAQRGLLFLELFGNEPNAIREYTIEQTKTLVQYSQVLNKVVQVFDLPNGASTRP